MSPSRRLKSMSLSGSVYSWLKAILISIVLNVTIFGLLPILIQQQNKTPDTTPPLQPVQVIRMKKQETPPRKKTPEKRMPEKKPEKLATIKKKIYRQPRQRIQNIPFEINSRLPALPGMPRATPAMSTAPVDSAPQGLQGLFEMGEIDGPLTALTRTPPLYPYRAKRMGLEGWVKVRFIVNENGHTEDIRIIEARPGDVFNKSVIQCISGWRFKPGTVEGVPVKTLVSTTIKFELE